MIALDGYRARIEVEPLTVNQLGRIHREFDRLGFGRGDRAARLRATATLAGVPGRLASTKDLTEGEAGRVVRLLVGCRTAGELCALLVPEPEPRGRGLLGGVSAWLRGN